MGIYPSFPLPDLPSELLKVALTDLGMAEQDPHTEIHMSTWYDRVVGYEDRTGMAVVTQCHVCMAGAVLKERANMPEGAIFTGPEDFPEDIERKLRAINKFRMGEVANGLFILLQKDTSEYRNLDFEATPYEDDAEAFKAEMRGLILALEVLYL